MTCGKAIVPAKRGTAVSEAGQRRTPGSLRDPAADSRAGRSGCLVPGRFWRHHRHGVRSWRAAHCWLWNNLRQWGQWPGRGRCPGIEEPQARRREFSTIGALAQTHQAVHQTPRPAPSGDARWICHIVVALKEPFRPSLVGQADQTTGPVSRYTTDRSATGTRASNPKKRTCRLGLSRERSPQANSVARADVRVPTPSTVAESSPLKQNTRKCPRLSIPRSPTGSTYVSCCRSPQPQPQIEILGRPYD